MQVHVRYFAATREAAGRDTEAVEVAAGDTVADLYAGLCRRHPALADATPALRFAVDERFAAPEAPLHEGAVVALIPPVSGG